MDTTTLINPNKINEARVDLVLRASDALIGRRPAAGSAMLCAADTGVVMAAPVQPRVSDDPRPCTIPAPMGRIEGATEGHRVAAGMTHQLSVRGKAATKFSTRLGRRTCSPPV